MDWDNHFEPLHSTFKIESDTSTLIAAYSICFNTLFNGPSVLHRVIRHASSEEPRGLQIIFTNYC